jgi:TonB family protein
LTRIFDTLRPHSLAILMHVGLVCALLLLSPLAAEQAVEDVVAFDIVSLVRPEPPPKKDPKPPEPEPPPPPRPAMVPPKVVMKKVEEARDFHPRAEELVKKNEPEPKAIPSYEVPTTAPRFELSMEATVEGGDGIQVVAVAGRSGRVMADPTRPGDPDSDGPPTPPTYVPEVEVADSWEITEEPDPLNDRKIEPRYPIQAKAEGTEGFVVVRLWIDAKGKVARARIAHSGGRKFDQSALEYCRKLRFRPAMANETPVASRIDWTVEFRI